MAGPQRAGAFNRPSAQLVTTAVCVSAHHVCACGEESLSALFWPHRPPLLIDLRRSVHQWCRVPTGTGRNNPSCVGRYDLMTLYKYAYCYHYYVIIIIIITIIIKPSLDHATDSAAVQAATVAMDYYKWQFTFHCSQYVLLLTIA